MNRTLAIPTQSITSVLLYPQPAQARPTPDSLTPPNPRHQPSHAPPTLPAISPFHARPPFPHLPCLCPTPRLTHPLPTLSPLIPPMLDVRLHTLDG